MIGVCVHARAYVHACEVIVEALLLVFLSSNGEHSTETLNEIERAEVFLCTWGN
jgi:hypothetical protein